MINPDSKSGISA